MFQVEAKPMLHRLSALLICLALGLGVSGCGVIGFPGVYRLNVEQGNIVNQEMVDKLRPGMSRRQVRFVLGTPLIEDSFNLDRWDYVYEIRRGSEMLARQQFSVFFDGETLSHFIGDLKPSDAGEDLASTQRD